MSFNVLVKEFFLLVGLIGIIVYAIDLLSCVHQTTTLYHYSKEFLLIAFQNGLVLNGAL